MIDGDPNNETLPESPIYSIGALPLGELTLTEATDGIRILTYQHDVDYPLFETVHHSRPFTVDQFIDQFASQAMGHLRDLGIVTPLYTSASNQTQILVSPLPTLERNSRGTRKIGANGNKVTEINWQLAINACEPEELPDLDPFAMMHFNNQLERFLKHFPFLTWKDDDDDVRNERNNEIPFEAIDRLLLLEEALLKGNVQLHLQEPVTVHQLKRLTTRSQAYLEHRRRLSGIDWDETIYANLDHPVVSSGINQGQQFIAIKEGLERRQWNRDFTGVNCEVGLLRNDYVVENDKTKKSGPQLREYERVFIFLGGVPLHLGTKYNQQIDETIAQYNLALMHAARLNEAMARRKAVRGYGSGGNG